MDDKEEGELDDEDEKKSISSDDECKYCICRTSDTSRFMIGCDNCNEWYHGDCINITEEYARKIVTFYCQICREKDASLQIKFKESKKAKRDKENELKFKPPVRSDENKSPLDKVDPDYQPEAKQSKYYESEEEFAETKAKSKPTKGRKVVKSTNATTLAKKQRGQKRNESNKGKAKHQRGRRPNWKNDKETAKMKRNHKKSNYRDVVEVVDEGPKHCYGPGCINQAQKGSKYCSDECGISLATNRILEILPNRIRNYHQTSTTADDISRNKLEKIRHEQQEAKNILNDLDLRQQNLEEVIEKSKQIKPKSEDEPNEPENETESELSAYCVTCGHEVSMRHAMRHMERCFNKYEGQTSFGSIFKTKIEGQTVFCDVYNSHQKSYCKRLRVLCPEHSKDPKIMDDEVCGCPLITNVFDDSGVFCRVLKKKCMNHVSWEKLRRAQLDLERLQQWLKLDELFEKETRIRFQMANRGGLLGLMLHQTIVHD